MRGAFLAGSSYGEPAKYSRCCFSVQPNCPGFTGRRCRADTEKGGIALYIELSIKTTEREQFVNITEKINAALAGSAIREGCCTVFVSHTTAAVTVNEDADPCVMSDMLSFLQKMVPLRGEYTHREGNSDAHIKAGLLGCSLHLIIRNNILELGTWQGVFLAEFDGPRTRQVKLWVD